MSLYLESILYSKEAGDFKRLYLVDAFSGRPVYMDDEGKLYCPFKNEFRVAPPLEGTPERSLWTRVMSYISTVLKRVF